MKRLLLFLTLLGLGGCGPSTEETIEPVPRESSAGANQLMRAAEEAAGNAQGRMSAEAGSDNQTNLQGETK